MQAHQQKRICKLCRWIVEDEEHFYITCSALVLPHIPFLQVIDSITPGFKELHHGQKQCYTDTGISIRPVFNVSVLNQSVDLVIAVPELIEFNQHACTWHAVLTCLADHSYEHHLAWLLVPVIRVVFGTSTRFVPLTNSRPLCYLRRETFTYTTQEAPPLPSSSTTEFEQQEDDKNWRGSK